MKYLLMLLVALPLMAATPYNFGVTLRLDNGAERIQVTHTVDGVEQPFAPIIPLPLNGAVYQKVTIWGSRYYVAGTSESNCASPCNIQAPLHYGPPKMTVTRYDGSNNAVGVPGIIAIPQYKPPVLTSYTMPLEIIGFEGFERDYRVTTRASADLSGTERLYLRIHRPAYEGKAQVRVNNGAWTDIKHSTVTKLGTHANWGTVASLDFGQSLLELSMTLPASLVTAGNNTISFRFAKEARDQSGFRIVEMNFMQPDVTVSQVAVSGSTVTVDTSTAHGYTTGDDVRIEAYPGIAWRVNGIHTIAVVDSDTFTFTISESDGKQAGTKTYSGVKVAKLIVDVDDFIEENPNSWTAPTGGVAATGATLWTNQVNLAPEFPGQTLTAKCFNCHARNGLDLKYFNYSNHAIIVRSMFHGWTEQQAKDVAAYIRANTSSNPGRPYNPVYQPCPNATVVSAYDWAGACTYDDVLPNNAGMIEEVFGAAIEISDWNPTRLNAHAAQQRIPFQLLDWNDWLPVLFPGDTYSTAENEALRPTLRYPQQATYWPLSLPAVSYADQLALLTANCTPGGCTSGQVASIRNSFLTDMNNMAPKNLTGALTVQETGLYCLGNPTDAECDRQIKNGNVEFARRIYSVALWSNMKMFEINHEWNLEQYGQTRWWPRTQIDRNSIMSFAFQSSFNLMKGIGNDGNINSMFDGTVTTEKILSLIWYQYQLNLNRDRNQADATNPASFDAQGPIDVPYTYGYFLDLTGRNIDLPMVAVQWLLQQFQRYQNTTPDWSRNGGDSGFYYNSISPQILTHQDLWNSYEAFPNEDRSTWRTAILDTAWTKFTAIACGDEQNGVAPLFTAANWYTRFNGTQDQMPQYTNVQLGPNNVPSTFWHGILMGRAFGVNNTTINRMASCGAAWWLGGSSTLSGGINNSQTSFTIASTPASNTWNTEGFRVRIDSEDIDCTTRSGTSISGCTRGTNGTTPASHSDGATVQIQIRWDDAKTLGTCTLNGNNLTVNSSCYTTPKP